MQPIKEGGGASTSSEIRQSVSQGSQGSQVLTGGTGRTGRDAAARPSETATPTEDLKAAEADGPLLSLLQGSRTFPEYLTGLFTNSRVVLAGVFGPHGRPWQSVILPLVRWVKAHPSMTALDGPDAWRAVESVGAKRLAAVRANLGLPRVPA